MPIYQFKCTDCSDKQNQDIYFDVSMSISNYTSEVVCPMCSSQNTKRVYTAFAMHQGLTALEKVSGTTKKRVDMGKHMKNERSIRKKNYDPGTREHDSNELWTGNEVKDGAIPNVKPKI